MATTWAGCLSAGLGIIVAALGVARGEDPPREKAAPVAPTAAPSPAAPAAGEPKAAPAGDEMGAAGAPRLGTAEGAAKGAAKEPGTTLDAEAKAARAEIAERLKRLNSPADQESPGNGVPTLNKGLREVLEERLHWLDEWDKIPRHDGAADQTPERTTAESKAELERVKAILDQAARSPESLLTGAFRKPASPLTDALRSEMKETLDATKNDLNDWRAKQEELRTEIAKAGNTQAPLRVVRDRIHQRVAALKSRNEEREAAIGAARTADEAALAHERMINFTWETRVESARLAVQEAKLAQASTHTELMALRLQLYEAHVQLSGRALEVMQKRYSDVSRAQEAKLQQAAASEQKRAAQSDDPLVKFRARRNADLLDLQAQVLKFENVLATNPSPSQEEQRSLADRAEADFADTRQLLADGKVSHLDALRLNNDFRRIKPERTRVVTHELAAVSSQLTFYENALSSVELELINDSRDDRLQNEDLLSRLPKARHAEARALFQEIETRQLAWLERKRQALDQLAERSEETHRQIERRIKTLDDQYGFIRTNIFWVRDQEPIGSVTVAQCHRELAIVGRALFTLAQEACDHSLWGRVSPEFVSATLGLVVLPWPLYRLRRSLGSRSPKLQ